MTFFFFKHKTAYEMRISDWSSDVCSSDLADSVTDARRAACDAPIHIAEQAVRGWDFGDASTAERVSGLLRRSALELIVDEGALGALVGAVTQSKRSLPVRWHAVPVSARGRIV